MLEVRRSGDRFRTVGDGSDTRHSFSGGRHYDAANTSFGLLVLHDEHVVAPGAGFPLHRHRDVEVVTWVLEGTLTHENGDGRRREVRPGQVQRLSAGTGVLHAERNAAPPGGSPVRFVQAWVVPDREGAAPSYALHDVDDALTSGELVPVVSGGADAPVHLGTRHAALHVARLHAGDAARLPHALFVHLFVARGSVEVEGAGTLDEGDAVRGTGTGGQRVTSPAGAEVLVWAMAAGVRG